MNETLRGDRLAIQAIHARQPDNPVLSDTIVDYVLSLDITQVRSQSIIRSLPPVAMSDLHLRAPLAGEYQKDIDDGWWLEADRHMLLKNAPENAGVTQETALVVGRRLGYIIPVDEHYKYVFKVGFSGSEDLALLLRPDNKHLNDSLGVDSEIQAIMADVSNNHIGGPLVRSAKTLYCRPHGGHARLVFGLELEEMEKMGLVYCQLGRDQQGKELRLSGDVALYPSSFLRWLDGDDLTDGARLWPGGPTREGSARGRLQ